MSRLGVSSSSQHGLGIRRPLSLFLDASDVWGNAGPVWAHEMALEKAADADIQTPIHPGTRSPPLVKASP
jgi:hypothetical protein